MDDTTNPPRMGEQHAQRVAEVAFSRPPGTTEAEIWREIASVIGGIALGRLRVSVAEAPKQRDGGA